MEPSKPMPPFPALAVLATALLAQLTIRQFSASLPASLLSSLVLGAWVLPPWIALWLKKIDPPPNLGFSHFGGWPGRRAIALGLLAFGVLSLLVFFVRSQGWIPEAPGSAPANGYLWIRLVLHQVVLVALGEELLFRGFLQPSLESAWTWERRGIVSSLLFALSHVLFEASLFRLLTFFPGILFAWLRRRYDSIWPGLILHTAANLFYAWAPFDKLFG